MGLTVGGRSWCAEVGMPEISNSEIAKAQNTQLALSDWAGRFFRERTDSVPSESDFSQAL